MTNADLMTRLYLGAVAQTPQQSPAAVKFELHGFMREIMDEVLADVVRESGIAHEWELFPGTMPGWPNSSGYLNGDGPRFMLTVDCDGVFLTAFLRNGFVLQDMGDSFWSLLTELVADHTGRYGIMQRPRNFYFPASEDPLKCAQGESVFSMVSDWINSNPMPEALTCGVQVTLKLDWAGEWGSLIPRLAAMTKIIWQMNELMSQEEMRTREQRLAAQRIAYQRAMDERNEMLARESMDLAPKRRRRALA